MSVSDKEHVRYLYFVIAMFIGGILLAYNSTDTDKEELSPFEKCLAHHDITFDESKFEYMELDQEAIDKGIKSYYETGEFDWYDSADEEALDQEMKRYTQEVQDTCGYLSGS